MCCCDEKWRFRFSPFPSPGVYAWGTEWHYGNSSFPSVPLRGLIGKKPVTGPNPPGVNAWATENRRVRATHHMSHVGAFHAPYNRRGQALVEFAIVCLVVYMLLAAILTFGQILYCSQGLQQAADIAARELARTPLPADDTFGRALQDPGVCGRVYDEHYLVLAIDAGSSPMTFNGGHPIGDFPLVIQQIFPLMIYDELVPENIIGPQPLAPVAVLRYPGTVFKDPNPQTLSPPTSGYLVRIPVMQYPPEQPPGPIPAPLPGVPAQQVQWVSVVEKIPSSANQAPSPTGPDPFQVSSPQRGVVALRINYPYQSATMSGFQPPSDPTQPPGPSSHPPTNPVVPIVVDGTVYLPPPSDVGDPVVSALSEGFGPYAGHYGLGQQAAWGQMVRPYRSLISAQAIYRREVFQ